MGLSFVTELVVFDVTHSHCTFLDFASKLKETLTVGKAVFNRD